MRIVIMRIKTGKWKVERWDKDTIALILPGYPFYKTRAVAYLLDHETARQIAEQLARVMSGEA